MNEDLSVSKEMFLDDVYRAQRVFDSEDRWLDVGSHTGWFSRLAQTHGAAVVGGVDSDVEAIIRYGYLVPGVEVWNAHIESSNQLAKIIDKANPTAVKIDIQGAEDFLEDGLHWTFGTSVNKILIEWHYPEKLVEILSVFEGDNYHISFADRAVDILTGQTTYIIFATRR